MARTPISSADHRKRVQLIAQALQNSMPEAQVELDHRSPWELLVATILSAQCTDQRVNQVTPELFRRYGHPADLARPICLRSNSSFVRPDSLRARHGYRRLWPSRDRTIRRTGPRHHGRIGHLAGVGRKTANVCSGMPSANRQYRRRYPCEARGEPSRTDQIRQS